MRDLHVVGLSQDGQHVVLATTSDASKGGFRVALDDRLLAAVKGELPRPGETAAPTSTMSVKEIQARLRAGESVEELARSGGVPLSRVERFAGPILSERAQVVAAARRAILVRGRRGPSALSLGEAVDLRLSELPSMRADSVAWTAYKTDDGRWSVQVSWFSRGHTRTATWFYEVPTRAVTSADPASAALAHVDADGRRDDDAASTPRVPRPAAGTGASARPAAARTRTGAKATAAKAGAAGRAGAATPAPAAGASAKAGSGRATTTTTTAAKAGSGRAATAAKAATAPTGARAGAERLSTAGPAARTTAGPRRPATVGAGPTRAPAARTRPATTASAAADRPSVIGGAAGRPAADRAAAGGQTGARRPTAKTDAKRPATGRAAAATPAANAAASPGAGVTPAAAGATAGAGTQPQGPPAGSDVPAGPPSLRVVSSSGVAEPAPRARAARAAVPTWADVLLSTAPPQDREDPPPASQR